MTRTWPPQIVQLDYKPMVLPYLDSIPDVIDLVPGRQLFVDDYLVERTTLSRSFHQPSPCTPDPNNPDTITHAPVISPEHPWEGNMADAFSGGCWYDPQDQLFKLWYGSTTSQWRNAFCHATSVDGVTWEKPELDVAERGTNIVLRTIFDCNTVWLDHNDSPDRRYKYFATERVGNGWSLVIRVSADGILWSEPLASQPIYGDRTTVFYNPFRKVWVASIRVDAPKDPSRPSEAFRRDASLRSRAYLEDADPVALVAKVPSENIPATDPATWGEATLWCTADELDPRNPVPEYADIDPALYTLDATPYETIMLGLFSIWQGPENDVCTKRGEHKRNDIFVGFTRDGFHWHRPDRTRFISCTDRDGDHNGRNVQSVGGGCLVVGDKLYFYASGWEKLRPGRACTWMSVLRRDGFTSMDSRTSGLLETRPLRITGSRLFANLDAPNGSLRAEVLDADGTVIEPFRLSACVPLRGDTTCAEVVWRGNGGIARGQGPSRPADLASLVGRPVRFRFYLENGSFYSFWTSPDESGASYGYVAAGGPGLTGPTDTIGQKRRTK